MSRAIIIDDELNGINALKALIEKHTPEVKVVASTTDADKGIEMIEDYQPDILFLDISMPKMSGFELLGLLKFRDFKLVFTTAHEDHAIRAIKNGAQDYLLKPIDIGELKTCVDKILGNNNGPSGKKPLSHILELHVKDGIIFIKHEEIIRLEASGSYTVFFLDNNVRHVASKNLKECEKLLDHEMFFRCHPSHIINLKKVVKMISNDGLFVKMTDDSMPEILKKNKEVFLQRLKLI